MQYCVWGILCVSLKDLRQFSLSFSLINLAILFLNESKHGKETLYVVTSGKCNMAVKFQCIVLSYILTRSMVKGHVDTCVLLSKKAFAPLYI